MNATRHRILVAVGGLALMVTVTMQNLALAEGVVAARFHVDSAYFNSVMTSDAIAQSEAAIAAALAKTAKSHFRYLNWQPVTENVADTPQVILRMVDKSGGICDRPPTIKLVWSASISGTERPLDSVPQHDLYLTCDPDLPTQEPDRLQHDVAEAVARMLGNEAMRERMNDQVLKLVPIANELINHQNAMLLLPVSAERLAADSESEMVAKFKFAGLPDPLPGDIVMRPRSGFGNTVQVLILAINVPSVTATLPAQGAFWHSVLIDVLARSSDLQVYMVDYKPSPFAGDTVGDTDVLAEL